MPPDKPHGFAAMPSSIARDGTIDTSTKTLLLVLSSFAGADQSCFPSNATLCDCTGLSESTVRRLLRDAEKRGLVVTMRRTADNGAPLSNLYRLNFAKWGGNQNDSEARSNLQGGGVMDAPRVGAPVKGGWAHPSAPNMTSEHDQGTRPDILALASEPPSSARQPAVKKPRQTPAEPDKPASVSEVEALAIEFGIARDRAHHWASEFWSYWEGVGWKRGREPMRDWRRTLRTKWHKDAAAKPWIQAGYEEARRNKPKPSAFASSTLTDEEADRINAETLRILREDRAKQQAWLLEDQ